jgi:hypothetical protein
MLKKGMIAVVLGLAFLVSPAYAYDDDVDLVSNIEVIVHPGSDSVFHASVYGYTGTEYVTIYLLKANYTIPPRTKVPKERATRVVIAASADWSIKWQFFNVYDMDPVLPNGYLYHTHSAFRGNSYF